MRAQEADRGGGGGEIAFAGTVAAAGFGVQGEGGGVAVEAGEEVDGGAGGGVGVEGGVEVWRDALGELGKEDVVVFGGEIDAEGEVLGGGLGRWRSRRNTNMRAPALSRSCQVRVRVKGPTVAGKALRASCAVSGARNEEATERAWGRKKARATSARRAARPRRGRWADAVGSGSGAVRDEGRGGARRG